MSVYVDDMRATLGKMKMCHMIADSRVELVAMVQKINVRGRWIQAAGTYREHFDICQSKRKLAVAAGAIEISQKELARKLLARRGGSDGGKKG